MVKSSIVCLSPTTTRFWRPHEYVLALKDAVALSHRWRLHELIKLMPDDPDGIWGDLTDHFLHVYFSEIANTAGAYKDYLKAKHPAPKPSTE